MAVRCPVCRTEYDVTLFTFDRAIQCDCGGWVDLSRGHETMDDEDRPSPS